VKPVEDGNLKLPAGFGSLVRRYISRGLRVRCLTEEPASDSFMGGGEVKVVFPTPRPFWFGVRFVALTYVGPLRDGFVMVEVLPGRFSVAKAEREAKDWTVNAIGRGVVAEHDRYAAQGKGAMFTRPKLDDSDEWGVTSLTIPTLAFTLHTSDETAFVDVPIASDPRS
jgi:hypothetical protein